MAEHTKQTSGGAVDGHRSPLKPIRGVGVGIGSGSVGAGINQVRGESTSNRLAREHRERQGRRAQRERQRQEAGR